MSIELCASMMCANFANLEKEVRELDEAGIDIFHIDIMDGRFVDSFGMGYQDMEYICGATKKRKEVHLMAVHTWKYLEMLASLGVDIVYIHPEADPDAATSLEKIRKLDMIPGIAINPGTSIPYIEELFNWVDKVLVMCVNPGHAGRQYVPYVGKKVERLIELGKQYDFTVGWDGACTMEKLTEYAPKGVKSFVLGTSVLFGHKQLYSEIIANARKAISVIS